MWRIQRNRTYHRWLVALLCALIFSGLPTAGHAQDVTVRSDEWLFQSALNAYNAKDFFTAALYFQSYIQRNPERMRNDSTHASQVRAALDYSAEAVRAAMRCRSLALDNCGVNSQGLLVSKGFGLHSSAPSVIPPPPVSGSSSSSAPPTTSSSSTATPYAVVCLVNKTNRNINYTYRWGDDEWKSQSVDANSSRYHSYTYPSGSHSSPDFRIRVDVDFSSGTDYKTFLLKRNRNSKKSCDGAKKYNFRDGEGSTIKVFAASE